MMFMSGMLMQVEQLSDYRKPELKKFLCSFRQNEVTYALDLWAFSFQDCENKISAIRETLKMDGLFIEEV